MKYHLKCLPFGGNVGFHRPSLQAVLPAPCGLCGHIPCPEGLLRPALLPFLADTPLQFCIFGVPRSEVATDNSKHRQRDICRRRVSTEDAAITVGVLQGGIRLPVTDGVKGTSYPKDNVDLLRNLFTPSLNVLLLGY